MNVLVVPTIRESIHSFLDQWSHEKWDAVVVVEDNPRKTFELDVEGHYSWAEIEEDLGDDAWIISRRDSAIRSYGFLKAYQMGAETIFTLDDDCNPIKPGHIESHIHNMHNTPRWTFTAGRRTRGVPYDNLGSLDNVVISVGLWEGIPDYDSIQMMSQDDGWDSFQPPSGTRVMPRDQYFPLCGMNFAFQRKAAPLCYFPLMGEGYLYRRFDDIWFGIIAKKVCDHLGWHITCGEPFIWHSKASNKFANLEREASGIRANETFGEDIDQSRLTADSPTGCMVEIGEALKSSGMGLGYKGQLGSAISTWAGLFQVT